MWGAQTRTSLQPTPVGCHPIHGLRYIYTPMASNSAFRQAFFTELRWGITAPDPCREGLGCARLTHTGSLTQDAVTEHPRCADVTPGSGPEQGQAKLLLQGSELRKEDRNQDVDTGTSGPLRGGKGLGHLEALGTVCELPSSSLVAVSMHGPGSSVHPVMDI